MYTHARLSNLFLILLLLFPALSACGGVGGGNDTAITAEDQNGGANATGNDAEVPSSFITCNAPYKKCLEFSTADGDYYEFMLPKFRIRVPKASFCKAIRYEVFGTNEEKTFQSAGEGQSQTKDGLTYYEASTPGQFSCSFVITWENGFVTMFYDLFDTGATRPVFLVDDKFLVEMMLMLSSSGEVMGGLTMYYPPKKFVPAIGSENIGDSWNVHEAACTLYGICDAPDVQYTWVAYNSHQIDY